MKPSVTLSIRAGKAQRRVRNRSRTTDDAGIKEESAREKAVTLDKAGSVAKPLSKRARLTLRAHARVIQRLGRRAIGDIIEIGRRLSDAKKLVGHGKFLTWLAAEFKWEERTAQRFISVWLLASKFDNLSDLNLPVSAFYLLAAPSTPDAALEQIAMRTGIGNGLSVAEVKDIIANSRRGGSLRHIINVARQVLREIRLHGLCDESCGQILDRSLGDLDRDQIRAVIHQKCCEALERRESQLFELQHEIKQLKRVQAWSAGDLLFTPFPSKTGPHFGVPFINAHQAKAGSLLPTGGRMDAPTGLAQTSGERPVGSSWRPATTKE